jgi:hypothetical protein
MEALKSDALLIFSPHLMFSMVCLLLFSEISAMQLSSEKTFLTPIQRHSLSCSS